MKTYKPGTLVEYDGHLGSFNELLLIIEEVGTTLEDGPLYNVYNYTEKTFVQRSQSFLDRYYFIVGE